MNTAYGGRKCVRALAWIVSWLVVISAVGLDADEPTHGSDSEPIRPLDTVIQDANYPAADGLELQLGPLTSISLDVLQGPLLPDRARAHARPEPPAGGNTRGFAPQSFAWVAPGLVHQPLYFEDVALERYGQSHCLQPLWSGIRFFGAVPLLPYKMGLDHPGATTYTLGYARPGNRTVPVVEHLPMSWEATALQALAAAGFACLFP